MYTKDVVYQIKMLRPKDWIKNIFLFAPLFFTPNLVNFDNFINVIIGALIFCLLASSIYVVNDIKDFSQDQHHPEKKYRPIASGVVSIITAKLWFIVLSILSFGGAFFLSVNFFLVLVLYYVLNIAYCNFLKRISLIDVFIIAFGFILRVVAGAVLIHVKPSIWLLLCTGLLALFLALAKRRDDLVRSLDERHRQSIVGYNKKFLDVAIAIVLAALFIAYMTYTTLSSTAVHLGTENYYYTVPFVLFGILRYLQITLVEECSGSPTTLVYKDHMLLVAIILWFVVSVILVYLS